MTFYPDEDDTTREEFKRSLMESRQHARDALSECFGSHIDNHAAINVPEVVQYLHSQVFDYYRHIYPKRRGIREGWDTVLTHVRVPKNQTVELGQTDWYGEAEMSRTELLQEAEYDLRPVSLDTLPQNWQEDTSIEVRGRLRHRATQQPTEFSERFEVHLPPVAADAVIRQLDDCLEDLRWLPEAGEIEIGAAETEVHQK